jgi:hypothetical protein
MASFAEDGVGNLYILSLSSGDVFRITPVPEPASLLAAALATLAAAHLLPLATRPRRRNAEGGVADTAPRGPGTP